MVLSIYKEIIGLQNIAMLKAIHKVAKRKRIDTEIEDAEAWDAYIYDQLKFLNIILQSHEEASKAWQYRLELFLQLSAVVNFMQSPEYEDDNDCVFEEDEPEYDEGVVEKDRYGIELERNK